MATGAPLPSWDQQCGPTQREGDRVSKAAAGHGGGTVPPRDQRHRASHEVLAMGAGVLQPQRRGIPISITLFLGLMLLLELFCLFGQRKALKIKKESTRKECQELRQEHPFPAPPDLKDGRENQHYCRLQRFLLKSIYLPGGEQRFSIFVYFTAIAVYNRQGQHSAETPRGYFLTKPCIAVSEK